MIACIIFLIDQGLHQLLLTKESTLCRYLVYICDTLLKLLFISLSLVQVAIIRKTFLHRSLFKSYLYYPLCKRTLIGATCLK